MPCLLPGAEAAVKPKVEVKAITEAPKDKLEKAEAPKVAEKTVEKASEKKAATTGIIERTHDAKLIACSQEHEIKAVLKHFEKRQTNDNVEIMTKACKDFKANAELKPHNRDNFYAFIEKDGILETLEAKE